MTSFGIQVLFGFSGVEVALTGVPRFLVKGAWITRCLSSILPFPMVNGCKSFASNPRLAISPIVYVGFALSPCTIAHQDIRTTEGKLQFGLFSERRRVKN